MEKKLILVGMKDATTASLFAFRLANDLRYADGIPVTTLGKYDFDTPHVQVKFVYDIREQVPDDMRADAIYGYEEYRKPLFPYAKNGCLKTNLVGLRDWIVHYEKECAEKSLYIRNDLVTAAQLASIYREVQWRQTAARKVPVIEKVHFSGPVTAVIWSDGTKTVVRCQDNESFVDYEKGLAMAIAKKALGNTGNYYNTFKEHLPAAEE